MTHAFAVVVVSYPARAFSSSFIQKGEEASLRPLEAFSLPGIDAEYSSKVQ